MQYEGGTRRVDALHQDRVQDGGDVSARKESGGPVCHPRPPSQRDRLAHPQALPDRRCRASHPRRRRRQGQWLVFGKDAACFDEGPIVDRRRPIASPLLPHAPVDELGLRLPPAHVLHGAVQAEEVAEGPTLISSTISISSLTGMPRTDCLMMKRARTRCPRRAARNRTSYPTRASPGRRSGWHLPTPAAGRASRPDRASTGSRSPYAPATQLGSR